jgi:ATP-dependent Zn protease
MKNRKIIVGAFSITLFLSIIAAFSFLLKPTEQAREINYDQMIKKIEGREIKEINVKQDSVVITAKNVEDFYTKL